MNICSIKIGLFAIALSQSHATTFTVTNTSNSISAAGSLPWAISQANYNGNGFDKIEFNIPGGGIHTIVLEGSAAFGGAGGTVYIQEQVAIDASTQPGYAGSPLINIDCNGNASGFFLKSGNVNTISGFNVYNFTSNAVTISSGSNSNWIIDNWLGFAVLANGGFWKNSDYGHQFTRGIGIQSSFNVIADNTISGVDNAITIGDEISSNSSLEAKYFTNSIHDNFIGVNPAGTAAIGNTSDGIFLGAGAASNFIGPYNVISGNESTGIELLHPSNIGNVIFSNIIGMDETATKPIPNRELGILLSNGASGNAIGGPFGGNFIGFNNLGGVVLGLVAPSAGTKGNANGNWVQYNVLAGNAQSVNNQAVGISIEGGSQSNVVESNSIIGQIEHGVQIINSSGNSVSGNWIGKNGYGDVFGNLGYGVFLNGAKFNFVLNNAFGYNGLGPVGQINSSGNAITY